MPSSSVSPPRPAPLSLSPSLSLSHTHTHTIMSRLLFHTHIHAMITATSPLLLLVVSLLPVRLFSTMVTVWSSDTSRRELLGGVVPDSRDFQRSHDNLARRNSVGAAGPAPPRLGEAQRIGTSFSFGHTRGKMMHDSNSAGDVASYHRL